LDLGRVALGFALFAAKDQMNQQAVSVLSQSDIPNRPTTSALGSEAGHLGGCF
jgi:hypothetical protein